jgi:hypothetical protein
MSGGAKNRVLTDDAKYEESVNLVFIMILNILKKSTANFLCMFSSFFEPVIITDFHATEANSSLDLTTVKCSTSKMSMVR